MNTYDCADDYRFDYEERKRKRLAREGHKQSENAQNFRGLRAKLLHKKRHNEKIQMKKQIKAHVSHLNNSKFLALGMLNRKIG